jgi:hypothetical protein
VGVTSFLVRFKRDKKAVLEKDVGKNLNNKVKKKGGGGRRRLRVFGKEVVVWCCCFIRTHTHE